MAKQSLISLQFCADSKGHSSQQQHYSLTGNHAETRNYNLQVIVNAKLEENLIEQ